MPSDSTQHHDLGFRARFIAMRAALLLAALLCTTARAAAQEQVLLSEVMPELAGSELGDVTVANAPLAGAVLVVRANDVRRAIARAHLSADGLEIPKTKRVTRNVVEISTDALLDEQRPAIDAATSPCSVQRMQAPKRINMLEGPRDARFELSAPLRTGQVSGAVILTRGTRTVRIPVVLLLTCPPPDVAPGKQVSLVVRVGNVKVSALGEARQHGRVGEVIRVTSRNSSVQLRARVLDAQTVEVLP